MAFCQIRERSKDVLKVGTNHPHTPITAVRTSTHNPLTKINYHGLLGMVVCFSRDALGY